MSTCNRGAPGGICFGCGSDADCPGITYCDIAACIRSCRDDSECNAGFTCMTGTGRCGISGCSDDADCAPYVCGPGGRCERASCAGGAACPAPFVCEAGVCVEP